MLPVKVAQYEVVSELGRGQFGAVRLALGDVPGRHGAAAKRRVVALKTLRNARDTDSLQLLRQEFALLDQVKHRAIVRVFEFLESDSTVVMEYVHGVTLRTVMDDCAKGREQVYTEAAIEIGIEIADALFQAWTTPGDNGDRLHLVHRDLKPENVMLTPTGELRVLDFGLARVDNAEFRSESANRIRGTPLYMAPEQARGQEIDHRTDLFALGLLMYELLMGRPAYRIPLDAADPVAAAFAAIEAGALAKECAELESKLPGMGPVIARLLQANPRNRYPNGQDLLVDLRRQLYRGNYLKEFCTFYFGRLHPMGEAPTPESPQGAKMSSGNRKSMEERLQASLLAEDGEGEPGPKAPVPVRRVPKATPAATEPPPPAAPRPGAAPRITPRSASAARAAPAAAEDDWVPPSVKGPALQPKSPASPPRNVGARSPAEAGMLEMVPLSSPDQQEASADPSATAFFAIPAPKNDRKNSSPPPSPTPSFAPPGGPAPMASGHMQPPPLAPQGGGPNPSMGGQGIGMGQPMGGQGIGMGAGGGIQGPMAGYGGQSQTPFNVQGPVPTQGSSVESRMQSTRVFAVIAAAFAMLCMAVLVAGGIIFWKLSQEEAAPVVVATTTTTTAPPPKKAADTGQALPKVVPKAASTSSKPKSTTPAAPKLGATGNVSVTFSGAQMPTSIEITCGSGFREKKSLGGGTASFAGVPTSGDCKGFPKGGVVGSAFSVRGGSSYSCSISGTTTVCK